MNKKNLLLPGIAFVVFIGIFIYIVSNNSEDSGWIGGAVIEPGENYVVKEIDGETILENDNVGLSLKVPDGWNVEKKDVGIDEWIVNLLSPDVILNNSGMLEEGCGVSVGVKHHESSAMSIIGIIENIESGEIENNGEYEIINISGHKALKLLLDSQDSSYPIIIEVAINDKVYMVDTLILDSIDCLDSFNEILNSINID